MRYGEKITDKSILITTDMGVHSRPDATRCVCCKELDTGSIPDLKYILDMGMMRWPGISSRATVHDTKFQQSGVPGCTWIRWYA